jgi:hypothetical protein
MATYEKAFDQYRIYYMTGGFGGPIIDCFNGMSFVGKILFHPDGQPLPANAVQSDVVFLRYRANQFGDVIAILRNEKPLFLRLTTPGFAGFVATSQGEPVGEQEG